MVIGISNFEKIAKPIMEFFNLNEFAIIRDWESGRMCLRVYLGDIVGDEGESPVVTIANAVLKIREKIDSSAYMVSVKKPCEEKIQELEDTIKDNHLEIIELQKYKTFYDLYKGLK